MNDLISWLDGFCVSLSWRNHRRICQLLKYARHHPLLLMLYFRGAIAWIGLCYSISTIRMHIFNHPWVLKMCLIDINEIVVAVGILIVAITGLLFAQINLVFKITIWVTLYRWLRGYIDNNKIIDTLLLNLMAQFLLEAFGA